LEFNVPFQHKYGYIRDESVRRKVARLSPRSPRMNLQCKITSARSAQQTFAKFCLALRWLDHYYAQHVFTNRHSLHLTRQIRERISRLRCL